MKMSQNLTKNFYKLKNTFNKNKPQIVIIGGVVGGVASAVMACKATLKAKDIIDAAKEDAETVANYVAKEENQEKYSEQDQKNAVRHVYAKATLDIARAYAPAVIIGTLSVTAILTGNKLFRQRNVELAAAYATLHKSYETYRENVIEKYGADEDYNLRYSVKDEEVEETVTLKNGKEKTVTKTKKTSERADGVHAAWFDETSTIWSKNPTINLFTVKSAEDWANAKLEKEGVLFVNQILQELGLPIHPEGNVLGWVNDYNAIHQVDFGLYNDPSGVKAAFLNGEERNVLLEFNIEGNVWENM